MDLTPRDIQQKQFHDVFRGYAHEEVDLFLDEVAAAFDRVFRENQGFHHRLRELEEELTKARGSEDMLKRMLVTAQETADKAVQEAKAKAQEMVTSSDAQAKRIVLDAEAKAQQILAEARTKADQIVAGAISKERQLQVSIEGMKRFDQEYRARLSAFMEAQLEQLAKGPDLPAEPRPIGEAKEVAVDALSVAPAGSVPTPEMDQTQSATPLAEPVKEPPRLQATNEMEDEPGERFIASPSQADSRSTAPGEPPLAPAVVRVPEARNQAEEAAAPGEEERSIRELFWGDD